jgi:hypothetical protein
MDLEDSCLHPDFYFSRYITVTADCIAYTFECHEFTTSSAYALLRLVSSRHIVILHFNQYHHHISSSLLTGSSSTPSHSPSPYRRPHLQLSLPPISHSFRSRPTNREILGPRQSQNPLPATHSSTLSLFLCRKRQAMADQPLRLGAAHPLHHYFLLHPLSFAICCFPFSDFLLARSPCGVAVSRSMLLLILPLLPLLPLESTVLPRRHTSQPLIPNNRPSRPRPRRPRRHPHPPPPKKKKFPLPRSPQRTVLAVVHGPHNHTA